MNHIAEENARQSLFNEGNEIFNQARLLVNAVQNPIEYIDVPNWKNQVKDVNSRIKNWEQKVYFLLTDFDVDTTGDVSDDKN